jgi:death-on-curing protein
MHTINCSHIFHDGNKRTGLGSALLFLEKNNVVLNDNVTQKQLIRFALLVAHCKSTIEEIAEWFRTNSTSMGFIY